MLQEQANDAGRRDKGGFGNALHRHNDNERDRAEGSPTGSGSPDAASARGTTEWWEEDFPELKSSSFEGP